MPKSKIYLDTSVINFLFADDAPEKKEITEDFIYNFVMKEVYEVYISSVVLGEILQTKTEAKRAKLLQKTEYISPLLADESKEREIERLAKLYIDEKIIPAKKVADALHIAISTVNQFDYLVSWNYKHLANTNRERKILLTNMKHNYLHALRIITPIELIDYGN